MAKKGSTSSADMKPIKTAFNRSSLVAHLAEVAATELKAARALMAALEATILASVHKKGLGSFTLPGLLKVNVINVPAKKKRKGIDPFTKVEREFAAKPATVKIKTRALKKLKDAALWRERLRSTGVRPGASHSSKRRAAGRKPPPEAHKRHACPANHRKTWMHGTRA